MAAADRFLSFEDDELARDLRLRIRGRHRGAAGCVDRSERGKLALTGAEAKSFLQGQVSNDVEALTPGHRLLRRVPDPEGQDARGPADPRRRRRAAARHRAGRAAGAVQHDPPLQHRLRRGAAQADAGDGLLSLLGPAAGGGGVDGRAPPSTRTSPARSAGSPVRAVRTDAGHRPVLRRRPTPRRCGAALRGARRSRRCPRRSPTCVRIERGRPRYGVDLDDTVIPQEAGLNAARGVVHQGLLRRPGDGRPAVLPRQAQPPAAGAAAVAAGRDRRRDRLRRRTVGRLGSVAESPVAGADRAGAGPPRGAARLTGDASAPTRSRRSSSSSPSPPTRLTGAQPANAASARAVRRRAQRQLRRVGMRRQPGAEDPHLVDLVGRHVGAELADPPAAGQRGLPCAPRAVEVVGRAGPSRPAGRRPARSRRRGLGGMRGEDSRGRAWVASSTPPRRPSTVPRRRGAGAATAARS